MIDPNMKDFYGRLKRIDRIHRSGGGFEAQGTLGMAYYNSLRAQRRRHGWVMPTALVLMAVIGIKAGVHATIGDQAYGERIALLAGGDTADRIGAYVLQADPLTLSVSGLIRKFP